MPNELEQFLHGIGEKIVEGAKPAEKKKPNMASMLRVNPATAFKLDSTPKKADPMRALRVDATRVATDVQRAVSGNEAASDAVMKFAKNGFELGKTDLVISAGRTSQKTGGGRRGYDAGIGIAASGDDPAGLRNLLNPTEQIGFDIATSLARGMSTLILPPDITDPIAAFAYYTTHGVGEQALPPEQRMPVMATLASDNRAREGAALAIEERKGFWSKLAEFFGV